MTRGCSLLLFMLGLVAGLPSRSFACTELSPSIQVDPLFKEAVENLQADSPTFARQCERIVAATGVYVSIRRLPADEASCCRARTTIRRYPGGALIAWVQIPALRIRVEQAELLGHEFEHIIEQIEMVDLASQAGARRGAVQIDEGVYESERAQNAGQTVSREAELSGTTSAEKRHQP